PQNRFNSVGAGLLALYPTPSLSGSGNNFISSGTGRYNVNQFSARIDHKLSDSMNLFGAYQFSDGSEFYPITNPLCSALLVLGLMCRVSDATNCSARSISP